MNFNIYTFHKGISIDRFDHNNTNTLLDILSSKYNIKHYDLNGNFVFNDFKVDYGSLIIFEYDDGNFLAYDFGDYPKFIENFKNDSRLIRGYVGQYNPYYWKDYKNIYSSLYPETYWKFSSLNRDSISEYRNKSILKTNLYWRGSTYKNHTDNRYRDIRNVLYNITSFPNFDFYPYPIQFNDYILESIQYKCVLGMGGGGGVHSGDICLRDIEMFGLGIPLIRPKYQIEMHNKLIPDVHYISVDVDIDDYKYDNNDILANKIYNRYIEVINDDEYLKYISNNSMKWYDDNIQGSKFTYNLINIMGI